MESSEGRESGADDAGRPGGPGEGDLGAGPTAGSEPGLGNNGNWPVPEDALAPAGLDDPTQLGDGDDFDSRLQELLPWLRRLARRMCGARLARLHDPEDLVQEVMVALWAWHVRLEDHRPQSGKLLPPRARSRLRDVVRTAVRRSGWVPTEELLEDTVDRGSPGPVDGAVALELEVRVGDALARLSDLDRRVVCARFWEGLSFDQVASQVGVTSAGAARKRCKRALELLKSDLAQSDANLA
jgi:RNA polymerase sigma factor (sigma-70 family)